MKGGTEVNRVTRSEAIQSLMKQILLSLIITVLSFSAIQASEKSFAIVNAEIYTVNSEQAWAEALAVRNGKIIAVGSEEEVLTLIGDDLQIFDLEGRMVLPGFQDPHLHALEAGINETVCFLSAEGTKAEYQEEIAFCLGGQRGSEWFVGAGVSMPALLENVSSPVQLLDELIPDRPAVILDNLGHGAWANSKAMQVVGYDHLEADPPGGIIDRDPIKGHPTGVVLENAQQKLRNAAFPPNERNIEFAYKSLLGALKVLAENGITSVSDAGGYWPRGHQEAWLRAEEEGKLTVRASNALYLYPDIPFEPQMQVFINRFKNDPDDLLRFNQAKIYVDGILSQATGALYQPYESDLDLPVGSERGFLYFSEEILIKYAVELEKLGYQLHFHATGDRAVGLALDAVEMAGKQNGEGDRRHRITHLYLVDEKDVPRFKELGVIADFQLAPSSTDPDYGDYLKGFIGGRSKELLPVQKLLRAGAELVISSDWDAEELSPLKKIEAVLTQDKGRFPKLDTVIEMMTINVARLLHQEDKTGSIEVGKYADLVVLDRNIFDLPVSNIGKTLVEATLLAGEAVYDPEDLFE